MHQGSSPRSALNCRLKAPTTQRLWNAKKLDAVGSYRLGIVLFERTFQLHMVQQSFPQYHSHYPVHINDQTAVIESYYKNMNILSSSSRKIRKHVDISTVRNKPCLTTPSDTPRKEHITRLTQQGREARGCVSKQYTLFTHIHSLSPLRPNTLYPLDLDRHTKMVRFRSYRACVPDRRIQCRSA